MKRKAKYWKKNYQLWLMLFPAVIYVFIFCYIPMYGMQLAFREYSFLAGITGGEFVGMKYFNQYFSSPMFLTTLKNTFVISAVSIIVGFPAPIILAMMINQIRNKKWKRTVQTTVYIPYFISVVVLVSMLNIMLANDSGVVGNFLKSIHLAAENTNLLGSEKAFVPVYVLSGFGRVWDGTALSISPRCLPWIPSCMMPAELTGRINGRPCGISISRRFFPRLSFC